MSTLVAIFLEAGLGSLSIMKKDDIISHMNTNLEIFKGMDYIKSGDLNLTQFREAEYKNNVTYKNMVDNVHTVLSCCSFPSYNNTDIGSCHHRISGSPLPGCGVTFQEYVSIKLTYIKCLAFVLVPVQLFCLGFDLMVLKTLQVTKEYDKLERELSNRKREKRNSMGYTAITDADNVNIAVALGR